MHARLTTTALSDGEFDDAAAVFERILPSIRELDGFKGMVILSELAGNRIVALTLWENEQAMVEADSAMDGFETRRLDRVVSKRRKPRGSALAASTFPVARLK